MGNGERRAFVAVSREGDLASIAVLIISPSKRSRKEEEGILKAGLFCVQFPKVVYDA